MDFISNFNKDIKEIILQKLVNQSELWNDEVNKIYSFIDSNINSCHILNHYKTIIQHFKLNYLGKITVLIINKNLISKIQILHDDRIILDFVANNDTKYFYNVDLLFYKRFNKINNSYKYLYKYLYKCLLHYNTTFYFDHFDIRIIEKQINKLDYLNLTLLTITTNLLLKRFDLSNKSNKYDYSYVNRLLNLKNLFEKRIEKLLKRKNIIR